MSDYVMTKAEELVESQRKVIDDLYKAVALKDLLIESLKNKINELEKIVPNTNFM